MNRTDLVKKIALRMSVTEVQARDFIHSFQGILEEEILTERTIMLLGFGTFTLWQQAERSEKRCADRYSCTQQREVQTG